MPVVALSAASGEGVDRLMDAVMKAHAVWNRRVPTAALNRFLAQAIDAHPPPAVSGRRMRLDYITQPKARPPTFILFSSRALKLCPRLIGVIWSMACAKISICRARRSG